MPVLPPVAVLGNDSPIGLSLVRELGRHGVPVVAAGRHEHALIRHSRHVTAFEVLQRPLADWLPGFVTRHGLAAIFAVSENDLLELAPLKGTLGACRLLVPDPAPLAAVLDKRRTLAIAAGLGIAVPSSWQPSPTDDRPATLAALSYPVAVKWPDPNRVAAALAAHGLDLEKVEYAADALALAAILARYDPLGDWPLVQTWCPGEGLGQMLFMHEGRATLRFQHRRLREWPPSGGVSSLCAAEPRDAHPATMARSEALLAALGWDGPAMVEYRHDPATGTDWLMEVNGRYWGSLPLARHCHAEFAWEAYRTAVLGERGDALGTPRDDLRARYFIPDLKHIAAVLGDRRRPLGERLGRLARFFADYLDPRVRWYVWSAADPRPLIDDFADIVRRALGRA